MVFAFLFSLEKKNQQKKKQKRRNKKLLKKHIELSITNRKKQQVKVKTETKAKKDHHVLDVSNNSFPNNFWQRSALLLFLF